ncbi:MAG: nitronate monooxygenase [Bacteroidales bacterium]|jgi:NAD(P)H-dependent flavin oxidoreductase YrpB (nitropropane dioxygenase family)|nr:nitronate monooxygenase [Bacteroidales bacterium]
MNPLRIGDLRVKLPIIQGGMGVAISLSGLASAVANAGGIGVISAVAIGMTESGSMKNYREANKTALIREIRKARKMTSGILGVNLMVAVTDYEDLLEVALEEEIDVMILGAGLPLKMPAYVLERGFENIPTKFIPKVSSAKAARLIFTSWAKNFNHIPDAVIVEGPLAGGHLGFKKEDLMNEPDSLESIVEETVEVLKTFENDFHKEIPVIAGGGIYDGKDIYHIMQKGAKGVKMGSRFVTTNECDASVKFKEMYIQSQEKDITLINSPVGLPGRAIRNKFVDRINSGDTKPFKCSWKCLKSCDAKNAPYCIAQALHNAAQGNLDEGFAFAGTKAYRATKIQSVAEVILDLKVDYYKMKYMKYLQSFSGIKVIPENIRIPDVFPKIRLA